jgi:uncharacterized phage-associated protein
MTEEILGPPYDGRAVANCVLEFAEEDGVDLTQMQVLKILYFAHGWFLAAYGEPLIAQPFEAWEYGPVIRVVRESLRQYGKGPIKNRIEAFDVSTGEIYEFPSCLYKGHREFIRNIFSAYCRHDGWTLSEITHEKDSPWDKIWNSKLPIGRLSLRIDNREIQSYFENMPQRFGAIH